MNAFSSPNARAPRFGLLLLAIAVAIPTPRARAQSQYPVRPLPLVGYNANVIADGTSAEASTSQPLDGTYVYFAEGFESLPSNLGLPAGNTFVSAANPNATFLIQPAAAAGNNVVLLIDQADVDDDDSKYGKGILELTQPASFNALAFLVTGLNSSNPVSYTLVFADGTQTQGTFVAPDNVVGTGAVALSGFGRVNRTTGALDTGIPATTPMLFEIDIALSSADAARELTEIDFANLCPGPFVSAVGPSPRKVAIFGVSGASTTLPAPLPIAVTGFNQDVIADPGTSTLASTSTTLDTVYDYYAPGFNPAAPVIGLPAGTTFTSAANLNASFALQPVADDNALLFPDMGTLTLAAPGSYSNLAVLETGLNGSATVNYVLHFNDNGASTTGTFIAYDNGLNYDNSSLENPAIAGFGRVIRATGQVDRSQTIDEPRLFEYDIALAAADAARPLASIEFDNLSQYSTGNPHEIAVFGLSGVLTANGPPVGEAAFSDSGYTVARVSGTATISVNRIGGSAGVLSVNYQTQDGTASAPNGDYTAASGTLTWEDSDTSAKTFNVAVNPSASSLDVDFLVALSPADGNAQELGSPSLTTVEILDAADSATPIQAVDILSPPPAGITVVQSQAVTLYTSVQAIQGANVQTTFTASDDSGETPTQTLTPNGTNAYQTTWVPGAAGSFHLNVTATVDSGQNLSASVPITVAAADSSTNSGPQVSLLNGLDGLQFAAGETITLVASATNSDGTPLASVQFYANDQLLGTVAVQSDASQARNGGKTRQDSSNVPGTAQLIADVEALLMQLHLGQNSTLITAVGTSSSGISSVSAGATVYLQSTLTTGLTCAILDPADGSDLPSNDPHQTALVSATNNAGIVSKVQLYRDGGVYMGTLTQPPFNFTLPPLGTGTHVINAIAYDANAVNATSNSIIVHAIASAPTVPTVTAIVDGDGMAVAGGEKGKAFVERTGDTSAPLTVYYKVKGTAVAGMDYKTLPGYVIIPAGASKAKVKIKPLTVETVPGIRKAKIKLLPATDGSYNLGDPAVAKIKVIDNG